MTANEELRKMRDAGLKAGQIAKILDVAPMSVSRWLMDENAPAFHKMQPQFLELLKLKIAIEEGRLVWRE